MANQPQTDKRPSKSLAHSFADPFDRFGEEMDRLFSAYMRNSNLPRLGISAASDGSLVPNLDVKETPEAVEVIMDVPGIEEKDIDVTLSDNTLTVKGKRESKSEEKKANYHRVERSYGEFQRRVALPAEVDANRVNASLKDGVLSVTLQKSQKAIEQEKKIQIKAG